MNQAAGLHENFNRKSKLKMGSDRAFGIVFAVVFMLIGIWPLIGGGAVRLWALTVAGAFALAALMWQPVLRPLNRLWFRFGLLLQGIVSPLVMALMFFATVTPIALIMRAVGKDPLHRRFDPDIDSYWIIREPASPAPGSMKNQF